MENKADRAAEDGSGADQQEATDVQRTTPRGTENGSSKAAKVKCTKEKRGNKEDNPRSPTTFLLSLNYVSGLRPQYVELTGTRSSRPLDDHVGEQMGWQTHGDLTRSQVVQRQPTNVQDYFLDAVTKETRKASEREEAAERMLAQAEHSTDDQVICDLKQLAGTDFTVGSVGELVEACKQLRNFREASQQPAANVRELMDKVKRIESEALDQAIKDKLALIEAQMLWNVTKEASTRSAQQHAAVTVLANICRGRADELQAQGNDGPVAGGGVESEEEEEEEEEPAPEATAQTVVADTVNHSARKRQGRRQVTRRLVYSYRCVKKKDRKYQRHAAKRQQDDVGYGDHDAEEEESSPGTHEQEPAAEDNLQVQANRLAEAEALIATIDRSAYRLRMKHDRHDLQVAQARRSHDPIAMSHALNQAKEFLEKLAQDLDDPQAEQARA